MGSTVRFRSARLRTTTARRATAEIDVAVALVTTGTTGSVVLSLTASPAR